MGVKTNCKYFNKPPWYDSTKIQKSDVRYNIQLKPCCKHGQIVDGNCPEDCLFFNET
ncbi:MAG: hypothetical protein JSW06_09435 [Thermoplasmatales archaeon]|nr:MAG: hypothetical protein JSW06_09435 [Thermoplasmatales archaeon]